MDATSNTDAVEALDSGLTPSTIPGGCKNAQNGVSVENVPEPKDGYEWYVFRASYGRAEKAANYLKALGVEPYIALTTVYSMKNGKRRKEIKPLIAGIVFAYLTGLEAGLFAKGPESSDEDVKAAFNARQKEDRTSIVELNRILSYYYDHFHIDNQTGKNPPLTIPYGVMKNFIYATNTHRDVRPVSPDEFTIGEEVRVVEGEFAGLEGKIIKVETKKKRLKIQLTNGGMQTPQTKTGRSRLLFQLPCLGTFCSASIPVAYFQKIE